jgi:hypothetical protein
LSKGAGVGWTIYIMLLFFEVRVFVCAEEVITKYTGYNNSPGSIHVIRIVLCVETAAIGYQMAVTSKQE